ncbi:MAG: response regulator, partial [Desulfosalsimonadaceae bacterium]|nr:response regulator [Desulfosalsimonadaceae bacterium]
TGISREEAIGHTPLELNIWVNPDDRDQLIRKLIDKGTVHDLESQIRHKSGSVSDMLFSAELIDLAGEQFVLTLAQDITERKKLESQLLQAQKMESVGRRAGGVAHDFIYMLSVILGHAEMLLESVDPADPIHEDLVEIHNAAQRSADITRQLLAFARKQTISPRIIDLNETIEGMLKMLRRLIGEDIDIAWIPTGGLLPVNIDPGQIDQLLANLLVNARDAIAGVGKVTIETANAVFDEAYCANHAGFVPGRYAILGVSDDGCGMGKEIISDIFEPFFTTKDVGQGTGLGLSTVYGIVKQNNGFINVYSEPGKGSTFRIYIPQFEGKAAVEQTDSPPVSVRGAGETVLLVEDESAVLKLSRHLLERLGYKVLPANSPAEAIQLAEKHAGKIDLLITDVVMPGMNGRDLANRLLLFRPGLKRLFMSGYTANAIVHRGVLEEGVHFIQKPFSTKDLGAKVRKALDGL